MSSQPSFPSTSDTRSIGFEATTGAVVGTAADSTDCTDWYRSSGHTRRTAAHHDAPNRQSSSPLHGRPFRGGDRRTVPLDGGRRAHWHRRRLACTSCPCSSLRHGEFAGKDRTGRTTAPAQGHCARPTRKPPTGVDEPHDRRRPPDRSTQLEPRLPVRRFQQPGDDVGRLAIACFEEVRVHVQGRRRVGVAEATARPYELERRRLEAESRGGGGGRGGGRQRGQGDGTGGEMTW